MKLKDGECIGGYTKAQWSSPDDNKFFGDSDAMSFNLSCCLNFPSKGDAQEGIRCDSQFGPRFTKCVTNRLSAYQPFNGDGKCISWAGDGYDIPQEGDKNMLTNQKDGFFTITELEVWEVKYL